jgi:hypothetical protein
VVRAGLIFPRIGISRGLLRTRQWTFEFQQFGKFLSNCTTDCFSRRAQLHGVSSAFIGAQSTLHSSFTILSPAIFFLLILRQVTWDSYRTKRHYGRFSPTTSVLPTNSYSTNGSNLLTILSPTLHCLHTCGVVRKNLKNYYSCKSRYTLLWKQNYQSPRRHD